MITKKDRLLYRMAYLNQVYKSDFLMLTFDYSNNGSQMARELLDNGYLKEREVPKSNGTGTTKVISITHKGRKYLVDKFDDHIFLKSASDIQRPWNTSDPEKLNKKLIQNRLKAMFYMAEANVLEFEKPPLAALYYGVYDRAYEASYDEYLYDNESDPKSALDSGIFYDFTEINKAIGKIYGPSGQDSIKQSRIKGVYISKKKVVFCYIANEYRNRPIKVNVSSESRAIDFLINFFAKIVSRHKPEAMVLATGNILVDKMCSDDFIKQNRKDEIIGWHTALFEKVYVIPHSTNGTFSLYDAIRYDYDTWKNISYELFDSFGFVERIEKVGNPNFIGINQKTGRRIIYLPYYDVKLLKLLNEFHDTIDIIAPPEMINTIANIVKRDNTYYDTEANEIEPVMKVPKMVEVQKRRRRHMKNVSVSYSVDTYKKLKLISKTTCKGISSIIRNATLDYIETEYQKALDYEIREKEFRKEMRK